MQPRMLPEEPETTAQNKKQPNVLCLPRPSVDCPWGTGGTKGTQSKRREWSGVEWWWGKYMINHYFLSCLNSLLNFKYSGCFWQKSPPKRREGEDSRRVAESIFYLRAMAFIQDPPDLWENAGMLGSVCVSCVAFISQLLDLLGPPCSH